MSTSTNQTTQVNSSMFTIKPLKLKPAFKSRKQALTTLENAQKANAKRKQAAQVSKLITSLERFNESKRIR